MPNALYYGDNLQVLRDHIPDESVDLIYLDPPFNSNASYNVLFRERTGEESPAQIKAFTDTWKWTQETERTFHEDIILDSSTSSDVKDMITAFREFIGGNALMAYLVMMTPRLVEMRRVLKPSGSIYLHCDPTASHYLKIVMDTIFGKDRFRNEITWKRTTAHGDARQGSSHFGRIHDNILYYSKEKNFTWNQQYTPYDQDYIDRYYKFVDENGRRYWKDNLTAAKPGGDTRYEWKGKLPPPNRYWAYSKSNMEKLEAEGRIVYSSTGTPMYKRYLDQMPGRPVQDIWDDIRGLGGLGSNKAERLGYPTQKPISLLERIIQSSSNEGYVVLDPFCGCGTAVAAAEKLNRNWFGIDITHLAVTLMKNRLKTMFDIVPGADYDVIGEPTDVGGARALAEQDRMQFQYWATSLLEAYPQEKGKLGADRGIDGLVYFVDGPRRKAQKAIIQVKSGGVKSGDIRDLKGVVEREKAALGLFITLQEPTSEMNMEAVTSGFYHSDIWDKDFPKLQIRTIEQLLAGDQFEIPARPPMYQAAQRVRQPEGEQGKLEDALGA